VSKTIAEHMRDVLIELDMPGVMWGDCGLLDDCASRCVHTTLMDAHPLDRHARILGALERSPLFTKGYIMLGVRRNGGDVRCRMFTLKERAR
jgi:hypothetical protein